MFLLPMTDSLGFRTTRDAGSDFNQASPQQLPCHCRRSYGRPTMGVVPPLRTVMRHHDAQTLVEGVIAALAVSNFGFVNVDPPAMLFMPRQGIHWRINSESSAGPDR
jgi:hypothetical protein